jgi:DNA helicase II / ATP-dependent DNA helicase PcrA
MKGNGMKVKEDFFQRKKNELGVCLNKVQLEAVLQTEGPLLLLASPGSGKTTTIIMRIGYLIEEMGVNPSRMKAVTFSRASAKDMKERFNRFFPELPPVDFSTIHSLAFEVVREYFYKANISYQLIEGDIQEDNEASQKNNPPLQKKIIIRQLFKSIVGENMTEDQMEALITYISYIKNKMIPEEQWSEVQVDVSEAVRILQEYERFKQSGSSKRLLDYDDMLTLANEIFEKEPKLLLKYQNRYDYVLTDESQDTSMVQHAIVEKLVRKSGNLCVVADDDQSIYSWRGAEPSYLLNFKEVYPNAVVLFMEQNYRSSKDIVDVANQFIKRNQNRYNKNMFTENPPHEPINIKCFDDYLFQAKYLVKEIQKLENLSEVAILYRNNSSSIALMNEFDRASIPFYMKDADNRFFSHWVVEDILNFMRMTFTDKRPEILEKIHLKMNGYISKHQMSVVKEINNQGSVFDNLLKFVKLQDYQVKPLKESKDTFQQMKGMPPLHAIQVIRTRLGYEKALEKICERLGFRMDYLLGILNTLEEIADNLKTMEEFASRLKHLSELLKTAKRRKAENVVTFSTFHSSKGLEYEKVYMIDLVDGVIPSSDDSGENMEEATRLFYVGMTRAKKDLELLSYRERDERATKESVFVKAVRNIMRPPEEQPQNARVRKQMATMGKEEEVEGRTIVVKHGAISTKIPFNPNAIQNLEELVAGKMVKHRVFGQGEITNTEAETLEIKFQKETKKILIQTCLELGLLEEA